MSLQRIASTHQPVLAVNPENSQCIEERSDVRRSLAPGTEHQAAHGVKCAEASFNRADLPSLCATVCGIKPLRLAKIFS